MPLDATDEAPYDKPFWIGETLIEPRLNQITFEGQPTHVEHQAMQVLLVLAAHPGQAVSREAILDVVWAGTTPNDEGLTQAICKLRKALGDHPREAKVIQTIRKVGYRLVAPVSFARVPPHEEPPSKNPKRPDRSPKRSIRIRVRGHWIAAVALLIITSFNVWLFYKASSPTPQMKEVRVRLAVPIDKGAPLHDLAQDSLLVPLSKAITITSSGAITLSPTATGLRQYAK